jgi:hypothetical protein
MPKGLEYVRHLQLAGLNGFLKPINPAPARPSSTHAQRPWPGHPEMFASLAASGRPEGSMSVMMACKGLTDAITSR